MLRKYQCERDGSRRGDRKRYRCVLASTATNDTAGDILALSQLIYQIGVEIKSVPDSAHDYQDLLNELEALDRALKAVYRILPGIHELRRLDDVRALAGTCINVLQDFLEKIKKFNKSLGP